MGSGMPKRFLVGAAALLVLLPLWGQSFADLESQFRNPPAEARPRTFWFWMNGQVTRDGITRDLEAMARVGLGGALIYDGGPYLPKGPVDYLSPAWRDLMTHAMREAGRLGLDISMHNAPGWSSSGGPWITPAMSMQQLVWSETSVTGPGRRQIALPQPQTNEGYYRDAFVLAVPEDEPYWHLLKSLTTSQGAAVDAAILTDGNVSTGVSLAPRQFLQFEFRVPFEARAITVFASRFPGLTLQASDDGVEYRRVCGVANPGKHGIQPPGAQNFAPVTARYFRLVASADANLGEVWLHHAPRLADWNFKANFAYRVGSQVTLPADLQKPFSIDPAQVRDLSPQMDPRGRLTWDVPAGAWTILRLGQTSTGQKNVSASEAGTGLECDKFSRQAIEFHFHNVEERLLGDKAFVAVSIDSYEAGMQNWTAQFPEEFRRRAGYDLRSYLPAMTGRVMGDAALSERFLFDVRRVQADLMAQNYYGRMGELCRQHGLKFLVEGYGQGVFDESQVSGVPDFPMTEFWERTPWTPNRVVKSVASAAHTYGKPIVAGESFTGEEETARWEEYPYSLKALGDLMFSLGLNQMYFHRYAHQPHPTAAPGMTMGPWGFHFDRTNTWFEQSGPWLQYLSRAQYLLRQGVYVADVLYFLGERPPDVSQFAMPVLPAGYNFDLVNAEALLARAAVRNGQIVMPDGASYRMLVLAPGLKGVTPEVMRKLHEMAAQGALILGARPEFSLTLRDYPQSEREVERLSAAARIDSTRTVADALREAPPDFEYRGAPDTALSWLHRKLPDGDLYFVANRQRRGEDVVCTFRVAGRLPELWQAETGVIAKATVYSQQAGRTSMPLHLGPAESLFIVFRAAAPPHAPAWISRDGIRLPAVPAAPPDLENNFTISVWAKPDINLRLMPRESTTGRLDETGKNYVVPAAEGPPGHPYAGIAVGRNGVYVVERSATASPAVLVAATPVSGWTHVAVVYRDGKPSLYLNGKFVKEGLASGNRVKPGVGSPAPAPGDVFHFAALDALVRSSQQPSPPSQGVAYYFEGNMTRPEVFAQANIQELAKRLPPPEEPPDLEFTAPGEALVWRSGQYALAGGTPMRAEIAKPMEIGGPWQVTMPGHTFAMPELIAWNRLDDPAVKYFSGAATYTRDLRVPPDFAGAGKRIYLDLGRVEVLAHVTVNGKDLGILWKEPYRVDLTDAVHAGSNHVEIAVTNLWPNRLIGDELLPPENEYAIEGHGIVRLPDWYTKGEPKPPGGRSTFATWQFYTKDEPLLDSGLLGPVRLLNPQVKRLEPRP